MNYISKYHLFEFSMSIVVCTSINFYYFVPDLLDPNVDYSKPVDIFAIGFEEMVDLNASNIMSARYIFHRARLVCFRTFLSYISDVNVSSYFRKTVLCFTSF